MEKQNGQYVHRVCTLAKLSKAKLKKNNLNVTFKGVCKLCNKNQASKVESLLINCAHHQCKYQAHLTCLLKSGTPVCYPSTGPLFYCDSLESESKFA